jgi:hypothetical protein
MHRRLVVTVVLAAALAVAATSASAERPHAPAVDPTFAPTGVKLFAESEQRAIDQANNPAYHVAFQPGFREFLRETAANRPIPARVQVDPYIWDYVHNPANGVHAVSWRNRYDARISGHIWLPSGATSGHRYPTVLLMPGLGGFEGSYWGIAETIQRAGYVVLSFDPQAQGFSDVQPAPKYCRPGAWQQPQEGGIREHGSCAGVPPPFPPYSAVIPDPPYPAPPVGSIVALHDGEAGPRASTPIYPQFRPNFVFGPLDATDWLLSPANTFRSYVDTTRIGIVGHSAGADGAVVTAGVDPKHRFRAAVAFDTYGAPPSTWSAKVPTMIQQSEAEAFVGPFLARPPADYFPSIDVYHRLVQGGAPTQLVALRATSHSDWAYVPESAIDPFAFPYPNQARYGERLAAYYAVAWLDRWLKGVRSADARLVTCQYDGFVDAASLGVGTYNARTRANVPYRLKGHTPGELLSPVTASPLNFDRHRSADLLQSCTN